MMSSDASKKEGLDAADNEGGDCTSVSSKPENNKQRRMRSGDISSTTNEPSSASATVSSVGAKYPTAQSALPTLADAAVAAAPPTAAVKKKPRRAGFRQQFLQQLRVMLDRESHNHSTIVQWSTDGSSFIINDQDRFEAHIIPTYFDNPIIFASFLSKIYRWGFNRVTNRQTGCYEFCSPTFRRLGDAPAAAAAASADASGNAGRGASAQVQQQQVKQQQPQALPMLQQVMEQIKHQPAPNPLPNQSNTANAIADLISSIQRQQPSTSNQQPILNQNNNYLQSFQQWQQPNPTMDMLRTTLDSLVGGQPSSAQLMGNAFPTSTQNNAMHTLLSLYGTLLDSDTPGAMSQPHYMDFLQSLLMVMQQVVEEELQRRAQVDAFQSALLTAIGRMVLGQGSGFPNNNMFQTQQGIIPPSMQMFGSNNNTAQPQQQVGVQPPSAADLNFQVDPIAATLPVARGDGAAGLPDDDVHTRNGLENGNDEGKADDPVSSRKWKSVDDGQYDSDDDSWNERLRPRKRSPQSPSAQM